MNNIYKPVHEFVMSIEDNYKDKTNGLEFCLMETLTSRPKG